MTEKILDDIIMLLGKNRKSLSKSETALIKFAADEAESKIKNYCNIEKIPPGLEKTAARLAVDLYRSEGYGSADMPRQVTSVRRGDVSTSFADTSKNESTETDYLSKYRAVLNSFRKLRW